MSGVQRASIYRNAGDTEEEEMFTRERKDEFLDHG